MSYPNSDLSAVQLTLIAVIAVGTLAAWLILVFRAAREPRVARVHRPSRDPWPLKALAPPDAVPAEVLAAAQPESPVPPQAPAPAPLAGVPASR